MSEERGANLAAAAPAAAAIPVASPPPVPRAVTPAASRRAWHEPRVHFWWIVALGLLAAAAWLAVQEILTWNRDARLIRSGTKIDAVVWLWGARVKGRPIAEEDSATLEFTFNGQPIVLGGQRVVGRDVVTLSGDTIPIYVDPQDPKRWTARTAPPPLARMLAGAAVLVAVAAVLLLVSVVKRRGVLATWRTGEARQAAVVETKQTALAPRSRLVRCALTEGADRRLIDVYVPHRVATLQPGDALWLVMPPGRPDKAMAAMAFG